MNEKRRREKCEYDREYKRKKREKATTSKRERLEIKFWLNTHMSADISVEILRQNFAKYLQNLQIF